MAASSGGGGVDWNSIIKPFVTYSVSTLSKQEVATLIKVISESENDFKESVSTTHPHSVFYDVVTVLSSHIINVAVNSELLPRSSFPVAKQAAKVLCESFLKRFPHVLRSPHPILTVKSYINAIQEFCSGDLIITKDEVANMLALLKGQELPPKIQNSAPTTWDKEGTAATAVKEVRRTRMDPTLLLYDQIALPVVSIPTNQPMNVIFSKEVIRTFQSLKAGQIFVDLCLSLPILKSFSPDCITVQSDSVRNFFVKVISNKSFSDTVGLSDELNLVYRLLNVWKFTSVSTSDAQKLLTLGISCMNAAFCMVICSYGGAQSTGLNILSNIHGGSNAGVSPPAQTTSPSTSVIAAIGSASTSPSQSDVDYQSALMVVADAIWVQKRIVKILMDDPSSPQTVWLNTALVFSKQIFLNIHAYMHHVSCAESKIPAKDKDKISLIAVQQCWNELVVSISTHGLELAREFLNQVSTEGSTTVLPQPPPAPPHHGKKPTPVASGRILKIDELMSAADRTKMFFDHVSVIEMVVQMATLSYRKASRLKLSKIDGSVRSSEGDEAIIITRPVSGSNDKNGNSTNALESNADYDTASEERASKYIPDYLNPEDDNEQVGDDNQSVSDLMTTDEDDDDGDDVDDDGGAEEWDDEPILGKWLESVLSPQDADEETDVRSTKDRDCRSGLDSDKKGDEDGVKALISEYIKSKDSPCGFIESSLAHISFLTRDIVCNSSPAVQNFAKLGFKNEQVITLLSLILKDLDVEKSSTEIGVISTIFEDDLNRLYMEFSCEIGKLMQNILAQSFLSHGLQTYLLDQLSIDLTISNEKWNLGLHPRALSVLVQILLLKPDREPTVASILKRLMDTLVEIASNPGNLAESYSDLPVEHAQTMVFLFHTLSLMQKKQIMIESAQSLIRVSNSLKGKICQGHQILSLSRLLMIFDYFIRQLYEPGMHLITQIQYNLFNDDGSATSGSSSGAPASPSNSQGSPTGKNGSKSTPVLSKQVDSSSESAHPEKSTLITTSITSEPPTSKPLPPARIFCDCTSLEREVTEEMSLNSSDPKPRFYNLIPNEPNYQENPRLDGLAMNFLMNKNENSQRGMDYQELIDAIIKISAVQIEDVAGGRSAVQSYISYFQYFLTRLVFGLPPPVQYLDSTKQAEKLNTLMNTPSRLLYMLIWLPRMQHRAFTTWIRDMLTKQGQSASEAEELIKSSTLSPTILMKALLCSTKWLSEGMLKSPSQCPAYFYAVEAALTYCLGCINDLFDDAEMISVLSILLNETMQAIRESVIGKAVASSKVPLNEAEKARRTKSASHLMSIGSGYLMNNPMSLILLRHIEPEFKTAMESCVSEDFHSFPDINGNAYKSDAIPSESFLLAVISGNIESNEGCLKHILGLVIKIFGAAVCSKNTRVPKIIRDELSSLLFPLLVDRIAEYLGESVGAAIDPMYVKTDVPLNSSIVEIIGVKTLQAVCNTDLRSIIAETNQNRFLEECLDALSSMLAGRDKGKLSDFEDLFFKSLFGNSGELLRGLLKLLISTKNDGVVMKVCKFMSLLLDKEAKEKHARKVQEILLSEDLVTLDELPNKLFSPDLFQNELVVEAACGFLSNVLGILSNLSNVPGDHSMLIVLLQNTIDITSVNFNLSNGQSDEQENQVDTSASLCHVLKLLIQMAGACETEEGHVLLFRQMTEWFQSFTGHMEIHLNEAIGMGATGYISARKDSENLKTKIVNSNLTMYMIGMEYVLDVGKAIQTIANQTPGLLDVSKMSASNLLLQRFSDKDREQTPGGSSPPNELDDTFDLCDSELGDDQGDDDESAGEDSDDEGLNSRLCTYTITQKEFMSQHWYHCHSCGMVDGVGVCSICAKVCHRGHDVTYAKFGSFFCDCGAKTDGSCLALVRRPNVSASEGHITGQQGGGHAPPVGSGSSTSYNPFLSEALIASSSANANDTTRRTSSPTFVDYKTAISTASMILNSQLAGIFGDSSAKSGSIKLKATFKWDELLLAFKNFSSKLPLLTISKLRSVVRRLTSVKTPIGAFLRVQNALESLRNGKDGQLDFKPTDDLVIPTLGSQEGAFENIKMTYNGDQGSVIRQLILSQVIRRNAIASLSAPSIRRHYLAVSQEKGKVTVLQLGALLSGADTGKKKLTLPRLATITLPFTVLTMASNPMRDDVLAVCGLKDCHILVVGTGGSISSHLVLQPQLESQNHIIKPLWLPGSQTALALLTADAVKVYDLGKDVISPIYYFLLPSGKVRDATFVIQGDITYILVMANDGRIYSEKLDDSTSAANGPYYITNDLNYDDTEMLSSAENNAGNQSASAANSGSGTSGSVDKKEVVGMSLYYSHALRLLFYTYPNGKSYVGTLEDLSGAYPLNKAVLITNKTSNSGRATTLGLCQWLEVIGHPGLLFAMGKDGTPYAMLMTETGSEIQEIKVVGKLRPIDMIGIRHVGQPGKIKTSLLILCEDGSLRVCDSSDSTEFWLNPRLRPHPDTIAVKSSGKKVNARKISKHVKTAGGQIAFPVDFFEHCQCMNDIDFGGNDLLQIYNVAQLKNRLNSAGMYVVSTKSIGFNLEVINSDGSMVMTGIRVLLGSQDTTKVPSFIQIFGRTITVSLNRARWYDIPLTREESLQADTKLTISFGPSNDSQSVTFVDSVKIYGKSKDAFGWPDDSEEIPSTQCISANGHVSNSSVDKRSEDLTVEKIVTSALELCELSVTLCAKELGDIEGALDMVTEIYLENYPAFNTSCRSLMCTILSNRTVYYEHKDKAVFTQCVRTIMEMNDRPEREIDPEFFHHIINCVKNIATVRSHHITQYDYSVLGGQFAPMSTTKFVETMCRIFQKLVDIKPNNPHIVPVDRPGIQRVDIVAMGLADIIYSLMVSDVTLVPKLAPCLIRLLLSRNTQICVPVRTVLVKRLRPKNVRKRRVTIPGPSPPHCATPDTAAESPRETVPGDPNSSGLGSNGASSISRNQEVPQLPLVEVDEPIAMLDGHDNEVQLPILNPLEAFIGPDGFAMAQGIDLQSDAEDEAMVELAIALSLQEQAGGLAMPEGLQVLEDMHQEVLHAAEAISPPEDEPEQGMLPGAAAGEGGAESDATASPPPSDDEGSTVATEGSTMRNSEPEQGGSESSGSSNAGGSSSGRSGAVTGMATSASSGTPGTHSYSFASNTANVKMENDPDYVSGSNEATTSRNANLKSEREKTVTNSATGGSLITLQTAIRPFRLAIMKAISNQISDCKDALSVIPLLQVLLVILAELDGTFDEEVEIVENLVQRLMEMMNLSNISQSSEWKRNEGSEMTLIVLRMLSILVSRWRGSDQKTESSWIARTTAETIQKSGIVLCCKELLYLLRPTWKGFVEELEKSNTAVVEASTTNAVVTPDPLGSSFLKPTAVPNPPDYSPFFLKQYVKTHCNDVLEELPLLLSEMALRLPYQVKKVLNQHAVFDSDWEDLLCEMLQNRNAPFVRRQARKLLLNIAGTRENYHLLRDLHNIKFHLAEFKKLIGYDGNTESERFAKSAKMEFKYTQLVAMVEHLNTCIDIATQRPASWQTFCKNEDALPFIVQMGCTADESLTTALLTLLKIAVDGVPFDSKSESPMLRMSEDEKVLKSLAHQIIDNLEQRTFLEFVKKYLLEHPVVSTRWQAHSLLLGIFLTSDCSHQLKLVHAMWELWPFVPAAGSRASQFVDILGYATLNNDDLKARDLRKQVSLCIDSIESQGKTLLAHPNANVYSSLVPFVSVDGYYLESEPCEVCHNIDKPFSLQKLNSIKADAKFTANSQIVKLTSTLSVIRLSIRLTEIKKARMIKTLAIYYSPKNVPIVELKNKPSLWQMARKVTLNPSQTEIKLDFSVPITAANIMLEFLDFYENVQGTAETLQCPRCSASVPAQPGVCSNCGENVFQCHKCRSINYDERDPFLCHSCGFCKYAKLEVSLLAKNIVAVDPIENEEDHKKAETAVSTLLEKADQTYKQQQCIKACLETMLQSIKERRSMSGLSAASSSNGLTYSTNQPAVIPLSANSSVIVNGNAINLPTSYASAAAAAVAASNAVNNNLAANLNGSAGVSNNNNSSNNLTAGASVVGQLIGSGAGAPVTSSSSGLSSGSSSLVLKNVQSLAYCYAIDCKNSYEELNRLMRKVGAYRKEMLKLDPTAYALDTMDNITFRRCYGCIASSITLSLKLLQALITAGSPRDPFDLSFLSFLLRLSQSAGSTALKEQVKNALCFFVKDDPLATSQLTDMINSRVIAALNKESWTDVSFETSEEISLLSSLLQMYDSCWEIKLRSLMKIFTHAVNRLKDPSVTETGLLPCLKIIHNFIRTTQMGERDKITVIPVEGIHANIRAWINGDPKYSFENWKKTLPKTKVATLGSTIDPPQGPARSGGKDSANKKEINSKKASKQVSVKNKEERKKGYLMKKYGRIWLDKFFKLKPNAGLQFDTNGLIWLKKLLFCPGSVQTRTITASLLKDLAQVPQRRLKIMELLTEFLEDLPSFGESCHEFMELYRSLATPQEFSAFLNAKGALTIVCRLLDKEIEKLHHLESVTLHSDLSQGIAVWELSRLLSAMAIPSVRRSRRVSLLSTVLSGYLALKRLKLHRTRPIEEAQEILLQLLEEITSGTEEETKVFMSVCVETLKKCPTEDLATPVFIFERLCSLIVHEENDVGEFFVALDKDPQQEDFLQGRMLGNPYSSNETGIGPLMRDIKNKICTDCELVALLEDDNGMELLVNNKIISLDLPVKEVYKKLWLPTNGQIEPMRIVYRMRGLLGDATEEFVESFASPNDSPEDNEKTYKLANVLVQCGGLRVALNSLENLMRPPLIVSRVKPLIAVILKLLGYCTKIMNGRQALTNPTLNSVQSLLPVLQLCLENDLTFIQGSSGVVHLTDQVLEILDIVVSEACGLEKKAFTTFARTRGSVEDVRKLLLLSDKLKSRQSTMSIHFKVLAGLTYTDKVKMNLIFDSFKDCFDFFQFDEDPNSDFTNKLEHVCTLVSNIQSGHIGATFKDLAIERNVIEYCLNYIKQRAPYMKPPLGRPDSEEWKEMVSKPALKYVLRLLAGLATDHVPCQEAIGKEIICVIHQLEQVSSDEHVGSLAENALEALRSHDQLWKEVEAARRATREEKKRMAMAMRQRQLNTMGMKTNEKGQVTAAVSTILDQMEDLAEETGLVCVICREGYKYQPTKVLGIYTYSKRCPVEDLETKSRKTYGYCTVSHFNIVHVDCHMAAIRLARSRDEWESASLQNANTRCNGLIPLWGQQVPESAFAACLARHNAYLQEATGCRDVGFASGAHDIKLLLLRFAEEKSFHEDTGGGGPESNLHLVPYLIHTALYVLNTTRASGKEGNAVEKFLYAPLNTWKDDAMSVEGVAYYLVVSMMVHSPSKWMENRVQWLKRVLVSCGYRSKQLELANFGHYRAGLILLGVIHGLYTIVFQDVTSSGEWPSILADYIRKNDEALMKSTSTLLNIYQQKFVRATKISDFVEFLQLNDNAELTDLTAFTTALWNSLA